MSDSIIIANGEIRDYKETRKIIDKLIDKGARVIAADGGTNHLYSLGLAPNYIVGDLDSSSSFDDLKERYPKCVFELFDAEKDYTDLELAIELAVKLKSDTVYLLGCLGGRVDHMLGNIFLLKTLKSSASRGVLIDEKNHVEYISNETLQIDFEDYKYFSFIPVEGDIKSITLKGMKYPLDNKYVKFGSTLGISNEIKEMCASVDLKAGSALIIKSND